MSMVSVVTNENTPGCISQNFLKHLPSKWTDTNLVGLVLRFSEKMLKKIFLGIFCEYEFFLNYATKNNFMKFCEHTYLTLEHLILHTCAEKQLS